MLLRRWKCRQLGHKKALSFQITCKYSCCSSRTAELRSRGWRGRAKLQIYFKIWQCWLFCYKNRTTVQINPDNSGQSWRWNRLDLKLTANPFTEEKSSPAGRVSTSSNDKISNSATWQSAWKVWRCEFIKTYRSLDKPKTWHRVSNTSQYDLPSASKPPSTHPEPSVQLAANCWPVIKHYVLPAIQQLRAFCW